MLPFVDVFRFAPPEAPWGAITCESNLEIRGHEAPCVKRWEFKGSQNSWKNYEKLSIPEVSEVDDVPIEEGKDMF